VRENPVVDHVAHEPAQLGVRTDLGNDLVERHRVEHQVVAQSVELQRLVVDDGAARLERQDIFPGRLLIHRDQEVDLLFPADVAAMVRANGVPLARPAIFDGKRFLPETGTPI
jgi:hypothetical protein